MTADLAFATLAIGRAEERQVELDCMVNSGAQVSLGNMKHMLKLALQHPQAVRPVTESGGPPGADMGIAGPFTTDGAEGTLFPVTTPLRLLLICCL